MNYTIVRNLSLLSVKNKHWINLYVLYVTSLSFFIYMLIAKDFGWIFLMNYPLDQQSICVLIICTVWADQYMYLHHFVLGAREAPVSELSVQFGLISTCISTILSLGPGKHLLVNYLHYFGRMSSAFVNYLYILSIRICE